MINEQEAMDRIARLENEKLEMAKAIELVLALHASTCDETPQWIVRLDPQAEKQLRHAIGLPPKEKAQINLPLEAVNGGAYYGDWDWDIRDRDGNQIAGVEKREHAEFIVKVANAHQVFVSACKEAIKALNFDDVLSNDESYESELLAMSLLKEALKLAGEVVQ